MSTQPSQRGSLDSESEMLPQDPPAWIVTWVAWLLLGFIVFAFLLSMVLKLPETVRCPFVLEPANGADPVQAPRQATILKVLAEEGKPVAKGAELFLLRSDEIRGWDTALRTAQQDLTSKESGLEQYENAFAAQMEIKKAEIEQAQSEVGFRENHAHTSRDLVTRMERLAKQGGESEVELIRLKLDLAGSEKDFSVAQRTLQQGHLDLKRMEVEHARTRNEQQSEIQNLKTRIAALQNDLQNTNGNVLTVHSPYDGIVTSVEQRTEGSIVQQGAILCQVARTGADPHARLIISETGLPKLQKDQRVRLFFDAFPYQRYGAVNGKLTWISPSAVSASDGSHFVGSATLDQPTIKSRRGTEMPLRVGMRGIARVVVGGRTPIEYVLEPIHQLRENMRD